jgi:hypothetical protein
MTITANSQLPNLFPQDLEYFTSTTDGSLPSVGSELIYTQDGTGRYLTFYWQHSQLLGLSPKEIVDQCSEDKI